MAEQPNAKPETLAAFLTRVIAMMTAEDRAGVSFSMPVLMNDNTRAYASFELHLTGLTTEEPAQPKDYAVH